MLQPELLSAEETLFILQELLRTIVNSQDMMSECLQVHQGMLSECLQVHKLMVPGHVDLFVSLLWKVHAPSNVE